jgi:hypothetical protein
MPVPTDHGALPPWTQADLPEPRPFTFINALRTIGPGAILLVAAIGGGEWIVGPKMVVNYGTSILWIATAAILLQSVLNLEAVRYTLYTGEPILTGVMRLSPGPAVWMLVFGLLAVAQLGVPALAKGCAQVLFAAYAGRVAVPTDESAIVGITIALILGTVLLLLSGKSIERLLERLSWCMIAFIFTYLLSVNLLFVPFDAWLETMTGFLTVHRIPEGVNLPLLCTFAATAGAGGLGNLVISNLFRDKGFGMGARVGRIGGLLRGDAEQLQPVGCIFPVTGDNVRRWRTWWKYTLIDQAGLWCIGCLVGMFLNVNLARAIVPEGVEFRDYEAGAFQARHMADQLWHGLWALTLLNGFWILFSTHLGNTDTLVRSLCDLGWAGLPRLRRWHAPRVYAVLLGLLTVWGLISVNLGSAVDLFKVLGLVASPMMALAAFLILRVNLRFLPREVRPPLWRCIALSVCALVYGGITLVSAVDLLRPVWQ